MNTNNAVQRRKKVLIVDDDPVILKTQSMKLTSEGYDVACAADTSSAVVKAREENPDVILLDITFPPELGDSGLTSWDGLQIMSWLKRLGAAEGVPFIIITASDSPRHRELAMAEGAIGFFQKPIDQAGLLKLLRDKLGCNAQDK